MIGSVFLCLRKVLVKIIPKIELNKLDNGLDNLNTKVDDLNVGKLKLFL